MSRSQERESWEKPFRVSRTVPTSKEEPLQRSLRVAAAGRAGEELSQAADLIL